MVCSRHLIERGMNSAWVAECRRGRNAAQHAAIFEFCGGGRPANKYFEHGRLDGTETNYCRNRKMCWSKGSSMLRGETVELTSKVRGAETGLRALIRRRSHLSPVCNRDNRDSCGNWNKRYSYSISRRIRGRLHTRQAAQSEAATICQRRLNFSPAADTIAMSPIGTR